MYCFYSGYECVSVVEADYSDPSCIAYHVCFDYDDPLSCPYQYWLWLRYDDLKKLEGFSERDFSDCIIPEVVK